MMPGSSAPAKRCLASLASARMDLQVMMRGADADRMAVLDSAVRRIDEARDLVGRLGA